MLLYFVIYLYCQVLLQEDYELLAYDIPTSHVGHYQGRESLSSKK